MYINRHYHILWRGGLYLRAKYEDRTAEGIKRAEGLLEQSIAIDSTYAPSWSLLSFFQLTSSSNYGTRSISEAYELAIRSARKAIAVDPNYAMAYTNMADIQTKNWEFEKAASNAKKALLLEPENIDIIKFSATIGFASLDKIIALQKEAIALDPLKHGYYFNLGLYLTWDNRLKEAEEAFRTYQSQYPNDAIVHHNISRLLLAQGKEEAALKEAEKEPDDFWRLYTKNFVVYALGRQEEAVY